MLGQVIRSVPFHASDVGGCGDRRAFLGEVYGTVVFVHIVASVGEIRVRDDIQVMEKDPKDFLCDVDDFLAPFAVRPWVVDGSYETRRLCCFRFGWVA